MEFMKTNFFDGPVMGKYRYIFSYDYDSDTIFNTPCTYDPVSNRWFSEFGYTYCTSRGLSLACDGDDMDLYWFWQKHPKEHIRETYYHWIYTDDAKTEVNITYTATEYNNGYYRNFTFAVAHVTEEQFESIEQKLMDWHTTGKLKFGEIELEPGTWAENRYCIPPGPDMNPTIGALIGEKVVVDVKKIVQELTSLTHIQDAFVNRVAEIIHSNYIELLSQNKDAKEIAQILYEQVISDPEIAPHTWLYESLERRLTDIVPFA